MTRSLLETSAADQTILGQLLFGGQRFNWIWRPQHSRAVEPGLFVRRALGPRRTKRANTKGEHMDTLQDLLNGMEAVSKKVADLEHQLAEARADGKKLYNEFQKRQGDLAGKFGFAGSQESTRTRRGRKPRSMAANIAVGGSRMVTNAAQSGKSQAEAKKAGLDRASELAKKHGLSSVPEEAVKMIEATLKRRYSKAK